MAVNANLATDTKGVYNGDLASQLRNVIANNYAPRSDSYRGIPTMARRAMEVQQAQNKIDNAIGDSRLTGYYNNAPTLAQNTFDHSVRQDALNNKLGEGALLGMYNNSPTLAKQAQAIQNAQFNASLRQNNEQFNRSLTGESHPANSGGDVSGDVTSWLQQALEATGQNAKLLPYLQTIVQHESSGNPKAQNNWDCVTLDVGILTRRGWLNHDDVQIGDETIGYNPKTGKSEWTRISNIVHYDDAKLIHLSNSRWSVTTTPNHRWLNFRRMGNRYASEASFVTTENIRCRDRLLISAHADTDGGLPVTITEASLLGWIAGDGNVEKYKDSPRGRKRPSVSVAQSKPVMVTKLKELFSEIPHSLYIDEQLTRTGKQACGPRHVFRLTPDYADDIKSRVGNPKKDAVTQIIAMSPEQRDAWLQAFIDAEASIDSGGKAIIYQSPGPELEAAALAVFLLGKRPRIGVVNRKNKPENWSEESYLRGNNPFLTGASLKLNDVGRGSVWCVTTDLGTWTARNGNHIFLTGNSNAKRGTPSKGLMQTIDSTFNAYKLPGHEDIWNPVDNAIAAIRYAVSRYGSLDNVPGIKSLANGGGYIGY